MESRMERYDEVDINDILSEITYIDEVSKVEFIG